MDKSTDYTDNSSCHYQVCKLKAYAPFSTSSGLTLPKGAKIVHIIFIVWAHSQGLS